jgi:hypothetical protein
MEQPTTRGCGSLPATTIQFAGDTAHAGALYGVALQTDQRDGDPEGFFSRPAPLMKSMWSMAHGPAGPPVNRILLRPTR